MSRHAKSTLLLWLSLALFAPVQPNQSYAEPPLGDVWIAPDVTGFLAPSTVQRMTPAELEPAIGDVWLTIPPRGGKAAAADRPTAATEIDNGPREMDRTALISGIEDWLSQEFGFPKISQRPHLDFASASKMASLHHRDILLNPSNKTPEEDARNVFGVYDDVTQTIYLLDGWTGTTVVEQSILVHEMVHHFQNVLGKKYACPEAREELAYSAQDRWLAAFGHSLADDLEIDPFSLLVATTCKY